MSMMTIKAVLQFITATSEARVKVFMLRFLDYLAPIGQLVGRHLPIACTVIGARVEPGRASAEGHPYGAVLALVSHALTRGPEARSHWGQGIVAPLAKSLGRQRRWSPPSKHVGDAES